MKATVRRCRPHFIVRLFVNLVNFHHASPHKRFSAYCQVPSESRKVVECDKTKAQSTQNASSAPAVLLISTFSDINAITILSDKYKSHLKCSAKECKTKI